jgi:hypothetical protein
MKVLLTNGPADGEMRNVPDSPPATLRVEVFAEVEEAARGIAPGEEFPTITPEAYGYRLSGPVGTQIGADPQTVKWHAHYVYDETLDPELAEHTICVGDHAPGS